MKYIDGSESTVSFQGKFLLNGEGNVVGFYPPNITPNELIG